MDSDADSDKDEPGPPKIISSGLLDWQTSFYILRSKVLKYLKTLVIPLKSGII